MSMTISLTEQINGRRRTRILQEFVTNSAVYPLFDAIRSISGKGFVNYWLEIPHYFLILAAFVQAWYLGRRAALPWPKRALGNLIAPALYTAVDILLEGQSSTWFCCAGSPTACSSFQNGVFRPICWLDLWKMARRWPNGGRSGRCCLPTFAALPPGARIRSRKRSMPCENGRICISSTFPSRQT